MAEKSNQKESLSGTDNRSAQRNESSGVDNTQCQIIIDESINKEVNEGMNLSVAGARDRRVFNVSNDEIDDDNDVDDGGDDEDEEDFRDSPDEDNDDVDEDDDDDDSVSSSSDSSVARLVQTARNLVQVEKAQQMAQSTSGNLNLPDCQLTDEEVGSQSTVLIKSDTDINRSSSSTDNKTVAVTSFSPKNDSTATSKPISSSPTTTTTVISAKAAATLGIDLSDKSVGLLTIPYTLETSPRCKNKPKDYFKKKIDKEFIGQLQRGNKRNSRTRESIHESLERLPTLEDEGKKSASSSVTSSGQHFHHDKSEGLLRNSFSPADFSSISPRHSTATSGISGKKNKIGFQFFRPKPAVQSGAKLVQVKELKRMIRAGKPSYEQIHNWGHSFEALLNDKYGLALFKDFLSTEFSDENIEFWIACQDYKHTTNPKKLAMKANQIYTEFIAVQANREVNLDSKTRLQTEADLSNPTVNTLENAQKRIQALMEKDSYRRFLRSEVYLTMLKEARETAKAAATAALAASLQEATDELDEPVSHLVHSTTYTSPFSFLSTFGSTFSTQNTPSLSLPGVAAAAAKADAGMNNIQDLQLLGLSTSRHMRDSKLNPSTGHRPVTPTASYPSSNSITTSTSNTCLAQNTSDPPKSGSTTSTSGTGNSNTGVRTTTTTTSGTTSTTITISTSVGHIESDGDATTGNSTCSLSDVNTCSKEETDDSSK
uniref:RGS domain-containing protein n=1 Tax=Trichobilharzia regenti TaxID=157069 RepID=A0AA85J802_TRIRE|nr:unnamed protein product [Trichobilharzia regenti]